MPKLFTLAALASTALLSAPAYALTQAECDWYTAAMAPPPSECMEPVSVPKLGAAEAPTAHLVGNAYQSAGDPPFAPPKPKSPHGHISPIDPLSP